MEARECGERVDMEQRNQRMRKPNDNPAVYLLIKMLKRQKKKRI